MRRFLPLAALGFFGFCLSLANPSGTLADTILWNTGTSGNWEVGTNWSTGNTPGNIDSATFSVTGTYNVTFGVNPASIQRLIVSAGAVTLQSNGTLKTLGTDAAGGNNSVFVQGTTTTLNLGGSSSNTMALFVPSNIAVGAGGTFVVPRCEHGYRFGHIAGGAGYQWHHYTKHFELHAAIVVDHEPGRRLDDRHPKRS